MSSTSVSFFLAASLSLLRAAMNERKREQGNRRTPVVRPWPDAIRSPASCLRIFSFLAASSNRRLVVAFALLTLTTGCKRPAQVSPIRLTDVEDALVSKSVYENMDPSVAYVDDSACADCHAGIANEFARHPMGRSLSPVSTRDDIEMFGESQRAEFEAKPFRYAARRDGNQLFHGRALLPVNASPATKEEYELAYAVGSGQKGRSYLIDHENRLFMSPLTWYPEKQIWDLSPGYEHRDLGFDRPVLEDCLFCHANHAHLVADSKNNYSQPIFSGHAIGCQRCHGAGELHVRRQRDGAEVGAEDDRSIVNPGRLEPALREAVCQQCHLVGAARVTRAGKSRYDYRPGMPLHAAIATFVLTPAKRDTTDHFVGQVEQMYASQCFQASRGRLGCISCHDPHAVPEAGARIAFYRARCLRCHTDDSCGVALSRRTNSQGIDDCISCHMPRAATDVRHAATTNHRIPRTVGSPRPVDAARYSIPIVAFPPRDSGDELDERRDLALGLVQAAQYHSERITELHLEKVVLPLRQAVTRNPLDVDAAECLGDLLLMLGRPAEAIAEYRAVLREHPKREHAVVKLADAASSRLDALPDADRLWKTANELNPWMAAYRYRWGEVLARGNKWNELHGLAAEGTQRFPTNPQLWHLLVVSSLHRGEPQEAQQALDVLLRLQPDATDEIQQWFDGQASRAQAPQRGAGR